MRFTERAEAMLEKVVIPQKMKGQAMSVIIPIDTLRVVAAEIGCSVELIEPSVFFVSKDEVAEDKTKIKSGLTLYGRPHMYCVPNLAFDNSGFDFHWTILGESDMQRKVIASFDREGRKICKELEARLVERFNLLEPSFLPFPEDFPQLTLMQDGVTLDLRDV